eukprot:974814-Prymnesium_polylepis.1
MGGAATISSGRRPSPAELRRGGGQCGLEKASVALQPRAARDVVLEQRSPLSAELSSLSSAPPPAASVRDALTRVAQRRQSASEAQHAWVGWGAAEGLQAGSEPLRAGSARGGRRAWAA